MTYSQTDSKKYKITDKVSVSIKHRSVQVQHPGLSAQDLAALAAATVVSAFEKNKTDDQTSAMLAGAICDGTSIPNYSLNDKIEFAVHIREVISFQQVVGDKLICLPVVRIEAYRPVGTGGYRYFPLPGEKAAHFRGVLELTISHGTVLVTEHRGWLGSNEIVEYLRKQFEAAVGNKPLKGGE